MINLGRTIGWNSRRNSREVASGSALSERLDRYVANVSQPGRILTPHERLDMRNRLESAIGRD
jgi:hypothetical protein